ncbi:hypothetical protein DRO19_00680 [Candidatus Bathyarchaeota archaeon]|nr:MAG: hypothetical protein DRO19_00680 [Candidatus Bathyarchaeota archaeon]
MLVEVKQPKNSTSFLNFLKESLNQINLFLYFSKTKRFCPLLKLSEALKFFSKVVEGLIICFQNLLFRVIGKSAGACEDERKYNCKAF